MNNFSTGFLRPPDGRSKTQAAGPCYCALTANDSAHASNPNTWLCAAAALHVLNSVIPREVPGASDSRGAQREAGLDVGQQLAVQRHRAAPLDL